MDVIIRLADRPFEWSDDGPLPDLQEERAVIRYVLPRQWSLRFALTKKQWKNIRDRHKKHFPEWEYCACHRRYKANTLDEEWKYDDDTHTKIFIGAAFICPGCHWLKSLPWRISTWLRAENELLQPAIKPHHMIDCLEWTEQAVESLRVQDLKVDQTEKLVLARLDSQFQEGKAAVVPGAPEGISDQELERLVKPGQVMVVPMASRSLSSEPARILTGGN
jgi:hypothetical protein